jgi:light-regulated signal transduction histidine kinase (bacteriophytochrome)
MRWRLTCGHSGRWRQVGTNQDGADLGEESGKTPGPEITAARLDERLLVLGQLHAEMHTTMTALIGFTEVLLASLVGELNERQRDYVEDVKASAVRIKEIVESHLELTRIDSGWRVPDLETFSLDELLDGRVQSLRDSASKRRIDLAFDKVDNLGEIQADRRMIGRVLGYLLVRALSCTVDGGKLAIAVSAQEQTAEIAVRFAADAHSGYQRGGAGQRSYSDQTRNGESEVLAPMEVYSDEIFLIIAGRLAELNGGEVSGQTTGQIETLTLRLPLQNQPQPVC